MAKKEEAITKAQPAYMLQREDVMSVMEALAENIGNEQLSRFDFPKIKIPPGDTRYMSVMTADDPDGEPRTTVSGIIVGNHMARSFWMTEDNAAGVGNSPPDCTSNNAITGIGNPGGECAGCPMAQFGSDPKGGKAQACKSMRVIYLLTPGMTLPTVIQVPPTSLKAARQYLLNLSLFGRPQYTVETEIGVLPKTNSSNQPYNQFTFKKVRNLDGAELESAKQYSMMFQNLLAGDAPEFPEVPES